MILHKHIINTTRKIRTFVQDYITELVLLLIVIVAMNFVKSVPYINILLIRQEVGFFLVFLFVGFCGNVWTYHSCFKTTSFFYCFFVVFSYKSKS